jgi:transposase-like protein
LTPKNRISQLKAGQKMGEKTKRRTAKKRVIFYTEAFKSKVVHEVLSGKLNKKQATEIYGISGGATILYWIRQSQGLKGNIKPAKTFANFAEMKQNSQDKKLEQENKELKELLRIAELRADLWQHAIEIAEQKLDIDIVKKFGAQQLPPSKSKGQKNK